MAETDAIRLDKWLWCARFYKTRKLAAEAVAGGKVHLNGQRTKPGKEVMQGSQLEINKGGLTWAIEVSIIPKQRRPASEAKTFYSESEASSQHRYEQTEQLRVVRAANPVQPSSRPSKKGRRLIHRFKRDNSD